MNKYDAMTTTERIEAVADQIEFEPHTYSQGTWDRGDRWQANPWSRSQTGNTCETAACVAGWTVRYMSRKQLRDIAKPYGVDIKDFNAWATYATVGLGITNDLALWLFSGIRQENIMPQVLRAIAKIPEGERDCPHAAAMFKDVGVWDELSETAREELMPTRPYAMPTRPYARAAAMFTTANMTPAANMFTTNTYTITCSTDG